MVIDEQRNRFTGFSRTAVCRNTGIFKGFQAVAEPKCNAGCKGRRKHREGDLPEGLPRVCTVDFGGFPELFRNGLQTRIVDDHCEAGVTPQADQRDAGHDGRCGGQRACDAEIDGKDVAEDSQPHECCDYEAGDHGQKHDALQKFVPKDIAVERNSQNERQNVDADAGEHGVIERVENCVARLFVVEQIFDVIEADKIIGRIDAVPIGKGNPNTLDKGNEQHENKDRDCWKKKTEHDELIKEPPLLLALQHGASPF